MKLCVSVKPHISISHGFLCVLCIFAYPELVKAKDVSKGTQ